MLGAHMNGAMLSRFFEDSISLQADEHGEFRVDSLPDGRTRIGLLMAGNHFCTGLWVIGPRHKAYFKRSRDIDRMLVATIKPGWAPMLLDVPASEFVDQTVMLKTLWGESAMALTRMMLASPDAASLPERFTDVALARKRTHFESSSARLARHAVRMLDVESMPVGHVAARLGVSDRHLRRTFIERRSRHQRLRTRFTSSTRAPTREEERRLGRSRDARGLFRPVAFLRRLQSVDGRDAERVPHARRRRQFLRVLNVLPACSASGADRESVLKNELAPRARVSVCSRGRELGGRSIQVGEDARAGGALVRSGHHLRQSARRSSR
jgi:hypothetical protein